MSVATPDIRRSLEFYGKLGFSEAEVGEAWSHPYAVVTDGRIHVGLHQHATFEPSLTFVKPGLLKHVAVLERQGIELEFRRLANDVFNELGWLDPTGHLLRLVEARTFSPLERRAAGNLLCGYFVEIALPCASVDAAKQYWEHCGFVGLDEPQGALPHVSCTSDTIDIGLYDAADLRTPALRFEVDDVAQTLRQFETAGIAPERRTAPRFAQLPATVLCAPEGTLLLIQPKRDLEPQAPGVFVEPS